MAKKKLELFIEINNEKEFENVLNQNRDRLICAEIYCSLFGSCTALDRLFTTIKWDWSDGQIILLKVLADEVEALQRFRNQSEPFYMFILHKRLTKVFRGVDSVRFGEVAKKEIFHFKKELEEAGLERQSYEISEPTPEEMEWLNSRAAEKQAELTALSARRAARQAARKRHRAELMVPHLQHLNFVLYWPHATHAHPELYERWDMNNIIMVGREEVQLTEEKARDILYAGDAPLNEASLNMLLSAPALAICFRLLDTDKHFVSLVRYILYEEVRQPPEDSKGTKRSLETAFDYYKSYSPSREDIWRKRREEKQRKKDEAMYKRVRRLSEMQRLARQAKEDAIQTKRAAREQLKLDLLKSGTLAWQMLGACSTDDILCNVTSQNLDALDKLRNEKDDDDAVDIEVPEVLLDELEEESSVEEDPNEYFPPAGLLIPGFYSPPSDIAKANGLAILFPKIVLEHVQPQAEFLPPHVLVMIHMSKRDKAIKVMAKHRAAIIHMGIFKATDPFDAVHVAYSVKQYNSMDVSIDVDELRLCFMLSIKRDLALLELMDLHPLHVSRDSVAGEDECAAMFCVDYGDEYPVDEDFSDLQNK